MAGNAWKGLLRGVYGLLYLPSMATILNQPAQYKKMSRVGDFHVFVPHLFYEVSLAFELRYSCENLMKNPHHREWPNQLTSQMVHIAVSSKFKLSASLEIGTNLGPTKASYPPIRVAECENVRLGTQ